MGFAALGKRLGKWLVNYLYFSENSSAVLWIFFFYFFLVVVLLVVRMEKF